MPVNLIKDKISSRKVTVLKDAGLIDYKKTAEYWFNLGYYYAEAGLYDDAIEAFTKAIALDQKNANTYYNRGVVYDDKGQHDRAIEDYNKAIALNPNLVLAYTNRVVAYALSGNMGRAISDLQKACDMGNENGCEALRIALENR